MQQQQKKINHPKKKTRNQHSLVLRSGKCADVEEHFPWKQS